MAVKEMELAGRIWNWPAESGWTAFLLSLRGRVGGAAAERAQTSLATRYAIAMTKKLPNIHPGEILLEEFLGPLHISQNALARAAGVPPRRINEIVLGKRGVTADTAIRLAAALGTSERFWLGLQVDYDLEEARRPLGAVQHIGCNVAQGDEWSAQYTK